MNKALMKTGPCAAAARADALPMPRGFTLIEMVVVISIIGLISAVMLPQLIPALVQGQLEGAARHLAGYGMSAMAHCTLMREAITVKFDLKKQQYWAIRMVQESASIFDEDEEEAEEEKSKEEDSLGAGDLDLMHTEDEEISEEDMMARADRFRQQFVEFTRMRLMAQAQHVDTGGILDEIGPLFDEPFSLEDEEETEEEILDPLLERTALPEGVVIDAVYVGSSRSAGGEVDVELSPLGLYEHVVIYIKNEEDEYYTVIWDPITGGGRIQEGKASAPDEDEEGRTL